MNAMYGKTWNERFTLIDNKLVLEWERYGIYMTEQTGSTGFSMRCSLVNRTMCLPNTVHSDQKRRNDYAHITKDDKGYSKLNTNEYNGVFSTH